MKKFWNWKTQTVTNQENQETVTERTLFLNGTIAEESWFDDDVTPQIFKDELNSGSGDIIVWINSPGGDCIAAAQIYNMLMEYKGNVTVKIDGIAASAASVIAMAGTKVMVSPVSMLMIHNPMTLIESLSIPVGTGVFEGTAPETYVVIIPLADSFELHADNVPGFDVQEARLSLFWKGSYTKIKNGIVRSLLASDFTITDRRYIERENDTGYHHYAIDVAKYYELED